MVTCLNTTRCLCDACRLKRNEGHRLRYEKNKAELADKTHKETSELILAQRKSTIEVIEGM